MREEVGSGGEYNVDWIPLESSVFVSAAYDSREHLLYLRFRSGEVYRYFDFAPADYRDFLAAESQGRYFAAHVRDKYRSEHYLSVHGAGAR